MWARRKERGPREAAWAVTWRALRCRATPARPCAHSRLWSTATTPSNCEAMGTLVWRAGLSATRRRAQII